MFGNTKFTKGNNTHNELLHNHSAIQQYSHSTPQCNHLITTFTTEMIKLNYPAQKPAIKTEQGKDYIFCIIRKRWFIITPEEWVRQNFLLYLVHVLNYPPSLIAVEKQLMLGEVKKRFDIVVYKNSFPHIIIECKEMNVALSEGTILQVLNYNANIQAAYMVITNGSYCAAYFNEAGHFKALDMLPAA